MPNSQKERDIGNTEGVGGGWRGLEGVAGAAVDAVAGIGVQFLLPTVQAGIILTPLSC